MNRARGGSASRLLFTITIFAGSFLLFLIQPLLARMALPRLGGAPAVWNSAMLVYQLLLLAGYAYAHWLSPLAVRKQALLHLAVCAAAALFLPIGLSEAGPAAGLSVYLWVPWLILASVGPLFLAISANAPLVQRWFAAAGQQDPYPLYAASNLGSFGGLIAYPLLLEPLLPLDDQRWLWSAGYILLVLLLAGCAFVVGRIGASTDLELVDREPIPARQWLRWMGIAVIPSGLMLSTTLFITTDLSPMPLLWVVPLGLYLLSFSVAFSERGWAADIFDLVAPYMLVPAAIAMFIEDRLPLSVTAATLLIALFVISTALHRRLFLSRPSVAGLTNFYLALAAGGALGGLFCALIAPLIFDWTYEYPLLLFVAAVIILPGWSLIPQRWWAMRYSLAVVIALSAAMLIAGGIVAMIPRGNPDIIRYSALAAMAVGSLMVGSRVLLMSAMAAAMLIAGAWNKLELSAAPGKLTRTYFGIYSVVDHSASRQLLHGTTLHGVQMLTPGWERWQTTYYSWQSGVGQVLQLAPELFGREARVAVVGLGTGTVSCYKLPGQRWTYFEIDPAMVELAQSQFSFLRRCAPDARIILGDARLELAKQPAESVDVLIVDAFSSDAIPMHLLTEEAFAIYARYLKPDGILLVHISNRHLDLEPVVAGMPDWNVRVGHFSPNWDHRQLTSSDWVALSRSAATLERLEQGSEPGFWILSDRDPIRWTDDRSSLLSVIK